MPEQKGNTSGLSISNGPDSPIHVISSVSRLVISSISQLVISSVVEKSTVI